MKSLEAVFGPNSALVEELYEQYQEDPNKVPDHWRRYFDEQNGETSPESDRSGSQAEKQAAAPKVQKTRKKAPDQKKRPAEKDEKIPEGAELHKIKGVASKIVENMDESIEVPTATSLRVLPMKMLTEDRAIINRHLTAKRTA